MSATVTISVMDGASPTIQRAITCLSDRRPMNERVGLAVQNVTRDHLYRLDRHATATRLGAEPSNFWATAAENVGRPEALAADGDGATITLTHPGVGRAFHAVHIEPGSGKKALTIPLAAEAYNQRAYRVSNLFVYRNKESGKAFLAQRTSDGGFKTLYLLVPSADLPQDRSLLPSDEEWGKAALGAAKDYLREKLKAEN